MAKYKDSKKASDSEISPENKKLIQQISLFWDAVLQLKGSETIEFQTFKLGAGVLFARNTPATAGLPWWRIET